MGGRGGEKKKRGGREGCSKRGNYGVTAQGFDFINRLSQHLGSGLAAEPSPTSLEIQNVGQERTGRANEGLVGVTSASFHLDRKSKSNAD